MTQNIFGAPAPSSFDPAVNVTQFGWSEFDKVGVTLIQDYIAQAQKLRDDCVKIYENLQGALDGIPDIEDYYNYIKTAYEDVIVKYPIFEADYAAFLVQYATIQEQAGMIQAAYEDFQLGKDFIDDQVVSVHRIARQIEQYLIQIQAHMVTILQYKEDTKGFRDESFGFRNECSDFAEEVRLGKVYRGIWNPQVTQAYPTKPDTNSYWDIVLNAGTSEYTWNGVVWKAGNSLVYMKVGDKFEQAINASAGVDSFNSRRGAILPEAGDYTAEMVGAIKTINGQTGTTINLTPDQVGAVPTSRSVNGKPLTVNVILSADDVNAAPKTRTINGKPLSEDIQLTSADVGSVPVVRTINGKPLSSDVVLTAEDLGVASYEGPSLGEIVRRSTSLPNLITEGDKVFLKEGLSITPDGGDEVTYAEAFRQLSSKDGKGWEMITDVAGAISSYSFRGVSQTATKGIVATFTNTGKTEFFFYSVDLEREQLTYITSHAIPDNGWKCETDNVLIIGDVMYYTIDRGYVGLFNLKDSYYSTHYLGAGSNYRAISKLSDKLIMVHNSSGNIDQCIVELNDAGKIVSNSRGSFAGQSSHLSRVTSFTERSGNLVCIALGRNGEIFWIANIKDTVLSTWLKRENARSPSTGSDFGYLAYNPLADLVYYGDSRGNYRVTNARITALDGDAGPSIIDARFPANIGEYCSWFNVGDQMFFTPGNGQNKAVYYKFNQTTRDWDPFKRDNLNFGLGGYGSGMNAETYGLRSGDGTLVSGTTGGGTNGLNSFPAFAISRNVVRVPVDTNNVDGLSNYMRVK